MKIFAYIVSAILALSILAPIVAGRVNAGFAVVALIAGGLLWAAVLWTAIPGGLKVTFIVLVSILSLVSVIGGMVGITNGLKARFDLPSAEASVTLGEAGLSAKVAIVYHPGGSPFPKSVVMGLGEKLASRGCRVSIMTARPALSFSEKAYDALVLCSPVYGGEIRPPLQEFVASHAPFSIPVFVLVTGGIAGVEEINLKLVSQTLSASNVHAAESVKIVRRQSAAGVSAKLTFLADTILETLGAKMK